MPCWDCSIVTLSACAKMLTRALLVGTISICIGTSYFVIIIIIITTELLFSIIAVLLRNFLWVCALWSPRSILRRK